MPTEALSPADPRNYLGFGRQASKGTAVAPSFWLAFTSGIGFAHNPNLRDVREAGGGQTIARQVKDFLAPGIEFAAPVRPDIIGALMANFLGSAGVPAGVGPYTHSLANDPGIDWSTWERSIADDVIERIVDGMIASLTLDYRKRDQGPELMVTGSVEGIKETDQGAVATAESYETDRPFLRSDCTWTIDTSLTPTNVESATIDLEWTVDDAILADAVTRSSLVKLHLTGRIELVQLFESADEAAAYRNTHYWDGSAAGTEPGELIYPGDFDVAADYGAGADARQFKLTVPAVNWGEAELTEPDPEASEAVRLTRRGTVVANPGGNAIDVTVINNRSTDYLA